MQMLTPKDPLSTNTIHSLNASMAQTLLMRREMVREYRTGREDLCRIKLGGISFKIPRLTW